MSSKKQPRVDKRNRSKQQSIEHLNQDSDAEAKTPSVNLTSTLQETIRTPSSRLRPADILLLQRIGGNRSVQRMLARKNYSEHGLPLIQRVKESDFQVLGVHQLQREGDNRLSVFFHRNSFEVETEDQEAIKDFFAKNNQEVLELRAFASEEEDGGLGDVDLLLDTRLNTVQFLEEDLFGAAERKSQKLPEAGHGKIDYPSMRRVEIARVGQSQFGDIEEGESLSTEKKPTLEVQSAYQTALNTALNYIKQVTGQLLENELTIPLKTYFGDAEAPIVAENLGMIGKHLGSDLRESYTCMTEHHPKAGAIAFNDRQDQPKMWLSPTFQAADPNNSALVLIHEAAHSTPGLMTDDLAYGFERAVKGLASEDALRNSDSYALFIREVVNKTIPYGDTPPEDKYSEEIEPEKRAELDKILATISRKVIATGSVIKSAYARVSAAVHAPTYQTDIQKPGQLFLYIVENKLLDGNNIFNFSNIEAKDFKKPKISDAEKLAAISSRIEFLREALEGEGLQITITKDFSDEMVQWEQGPGKQVTISESLWETDETLWKDIVLDALLKATYGISDDQKLREAYKVLFDKGNEFFRNH